MLVRRPEPPNRRAQAVIILPGTQFSPARQVPLAELHAPSDRLPRDPTLTRALALKERAAGQYHACSRQGTHKCQFFDQLADMTGATTESSTHAEARERSTLELRNWAGNIRFSTDRVHHPETVGHVQEIVCHSRQVRVLGSRHSFNAIADSTGDLISLDRLQPVLEVDAQRRQITIDGGVTYGRLAPRVHAAGFALHNTASLPHITVAGACATATHGSGSRNGILGSRVAAMEIVTADGTVRTISRADDGDRIRALEDGRQYCPACRKNVYLLRSRWGAQIGDDSDD